jgi:hypothetical protein
MHIAEEKDVGRLGGNYTNKLPAGLPAVISGFQVRWTMMSIQDPTVERSTLRRT